MKIIYMHCGEETNIRNPRSYEHFWASGWNKTWKKFRLYPPIYLILVPLSASGSHRGQLEKSNSLSRWERLFQSFLVASTAFLVLLIVNSKISLQRLQTGMREMCTAVSRAAWNTVMVIWLWLRMEITMSIQDSPRRRQYHHTSTFPQRTGRTPVCRGSVLSWGWCRTP